MIYIIPTDTCFGIGCEIYDIKNYDKIYKIKKRDLKKPLAIMVENFSWLEENTGLNLDQINFLKNYKKPWTILTKSERIKMILNLEQKDFLYKNKEFYHQIAFRVANNDFEKKLIKEVGPIFLTSANFAGEKEIYDTNILKEKFKNYLDEIKFIPENYVLKDKNPPSEIFEFIGESLEIQFLRK